ncbi:hypothetical protein DL764_010497 [Monosporascus ibericus]|uniref:C-CAP/cofactor C-like domain-containing protein n=1 Tax=Monosporascus ibericus TaxID=155417 RepID=A0A4Q4SSL9_9PEZI|nr:hypothetical protein DL764_010497 [Monosporascus ibericus]
MQTLNLQTSQAQLFIPFTPSPGGQSSPKMTDPNERFFRHFQSQLTTIQDQIDDLGALSPVNGERQMCTDTILAGISRLNNEVIDAGDYIPAYDQRAYSQAIKALTEKLNETTGKFKPKSRFQFKPRAQNATAQAGAAETRSQAPSLQQSPASPSVAAADDKDEHAASSQAASKDYNAELRDPAAAKTGGVRKPSFSQARSIALEGHEAVHIALPTGAAKSSASVTDLDRCVVDMSAPTVDGGRPFAGLALRNVRRSLVVAGRVDGPAHVTGVEGSVVVVAARQVRMHDCRDVDVYLHCASHPIIEDCSGVRFAPIPATYLPEELSGVTNQWDQVDDFKWLKSEPSPNWSVLPKGERISDARWRDAVSGDPSPTADDILRRFGIPSS